MFLIDGAGACSFSYLGEGLSRYEVACAVYLHEVFTIETEIMASGTELPSQSTYLTRLREKSH